MLAALLLLVHKSLKSSGSATSSFFDSSLSFDNAPNALYKPSKVALYAPIDFAK